MPRTITELDRQLCEIAGVDPPTLQPSQDWTDLAAITTAIVCECRFPDIGAVYRQVFVASDPAGGAQALLDAIWDQDVVLGESQDVEVEIELDEF